MNFTTLISIQNFSCALVRAKRKRCYDVTLSRQEGSTKRHLASALVPGRSALTELAIVHWIGCINAIKC